MWCPVCKEVELKITERQNIEIDYCPQCRGVWLDRGELDKLIEKGAQEYSAPAMQAPMQAPPMQAPPQYHQPRYEEPRYDKRRDYDDDDDYYRHGKRRKRGGLLGEIFDFD